MNKHVKTVRKDISLPRDWMNAIVDYCIEHDLSVSEHICESAILPLDESVKRGLSVRKPAHRPRKEI